MPMDSNSVTCSSSSSKAPSRRRLSTRTFLTTSLVAAATTISIRSAVQAFSDSFAARDLPRAAWKFWEKEASDEWRLCAAYSGAVCHCTGTVALHSLMGDWAMLKHVNGSILCSVDWFDDDPRPGLPKLCSCRDGPTWPLSVADGLNSTIARKLIPRIEIGPSTAGCASEDDAQWTACSVMSSRSDASIIPDRMIPKLPPDEQLDIALRKLDLCYQLAGSDQALRVLGSWPSSIPMGIMPVKSSSVPVCAVVYRPTVGAIWDSRSAIFCPTDPPHCLEESCECATDGHSPVDLRHKANTTQPCWACLPTVVKESSEEKAAEQRVSTQASPVRLFATYPSGLPVGPRPRYPQTVTSRVHVEAAR